MAGVPRQARCNTTKPAANGVLYDNVQRQLLARLGADRIGTGNASAAGRRKDQADLWTGD